MTPVEEEVNESQKRIWKQFLTWLSIKQINTMIDFEIAKWRWRITADRQYLRIEENDEIKWYSKNSSSQEYKVIKDEVNVNEEEMIAIVGRISQNRMLHVSGEFSNLQNNSRLVEAGSQEERVAFNESIEEAIINRRAVAAVDASIDERFMAAYWVITTVDEAEKYTNAITSSKWINGTIPAAEGLGLYNLIKEINSKTRHITGGEIIVYSDNKRIINEVIAPVEKESVFTKEAGATIAAIKEELTNQQ